MFLGTFNPAAYPSGSIVFNLSNPDSRLQGIESYPFELNREPQIILAVADGRRLAVQDGGVDGKNAPNGVTRPRQPNLVAELEVASGSYPRALMSHLLVFDSEEVANGQRDATATHIPEPGKSASTTMKTVMCDVAGTFLIKLHNVPREIQDLPTIESPWRGTKIPKAEFSSLAARAHQRMTMPVRSATARDGRDIRLSSVPSPSNNQGSGRSGSGTPNGVRAPSLQRSQSHHRTSTPPQGSMVSQDSRNQGKLAGRTAVVLGALYLQAGLWPDALRELERGLITCRSLSDYLWHGRSLELIIACMIMLSWANIGFQIPQVCYPLTDKLTSAKTPTVSVPGGFQASTDASASLMNLIKILPELCSTILTLYTRAANFTQEQLPQIIFFESSLRMVTILSAIHVRDGVLDKVALEYFVNGGGLQAQQQLDRPSGGLLIRKHDIATMLSQAMQMETEQLTSDEAVYVLTSLASRLSILELHRKKAFFIRELISIIIPSLVHARKVGAAEMGIHPATGLSTLITSSAGLNETSANSKLDQNGLRPLLRTMMDIYAVHDRGNEESEGRQESFLARKPWDSIGDGTLKIDILRACVHVCEALPDLEGIVHFNVKLLHAVKGTMLMPAAHSTGGPLLSQEEQTRILNSIQRTVGAAPKTGLGDLVAEYWDDCLLRDIEPLESSAKLRPHTKRDLDLVGASGETRPKDPFIFNSFAKAVASTKEDVTLVAGEPAYFSVTFQNVFDFDIEVDLLSLVTEGCHFEPIEQSLLIGPYCLQKVTMSGIPREPGKLDVKGIIARIRGCRQRYFPICKSTPRTSQYYKSKAIGLKAKDIESERPLSSDSTAATKKTTTENSKSGLTLTVIERQPIVLVKSPIPSQFAVMVIEGETKEVEIILQNTSKDTPVDFVLFSFLDSATEQVQNALSNKDLHPADLYDLQLMLLEKPALRLKSELDASTSKIEPGATATFLVEITGKPGLLDGTVQIDYAYLGREKNDVTQQFFTRQLAIPVTVTVNAGLELMRCNVLPFTSDFAWANRQASRQSSASSDKLDSLSSSSLSSQSKSTPPGVRKSRNQFHSLLSRLGVGNYGHDHCLVLLDIRNAWPYPLTISIQVREQITKVSSSSDPWSRAYGVHETIQPGHTSRSVLLLPRFYLANPHEPIPTLGSSRQFVVSSSKLSPELEHANREAFWFREELVKHLRGSWTEDSTRRHGSIDLRRALRLNARMIEAVRFQDVEISMRVEALDQYDQDESVRQMGRAHFALRTDEFATLYVMVHNRSEKALSVLLRLQPSVRDQPPALALDLVKRFVWTGMLQRTLHPPLEAGERREVQLGIMALCEGDYEIGASVEELVAVAAPETMAINSPGRRIWHSREPCMIDAKEEGLI